MHSEKHNTFKYQQKEAIKIATELKYKHSVITKLESAKTEYELDRILKDARLSD